MRRFDNLDQTRSRHIIMLSDMDNNGPTDQSAVANLVSSHNVVLHVLAPSDAINTTVASSPVVSITGAKVSGFDSGGVRQVVTSVLSTVASPQQAHQYVAIDDPYPWWWAALMLAALWSAVKLWRWRPGA